MNNLINRISQIAYGFKETVQSTYDLTKQVIDNKVPGVLVECGVAAGAQIAAMEMANTENRLILAYDSFEGIPLGGVYDLEQPGIGKPKHDVTLPLSERLVSSGITKHSIDKVKRNFDQLGIPYKNVQFIKGWFQDTLPLNNISDIALLRLDGDLYESTMVCLEYLFPKVSKGGIVIIDDYALAGANKAFHEYMERNDIEFTLIKLPPADNKVVWFEKQ
jgi:O-methyltransferase